MDSEAPERESKSEVAREKPRDEEGHFIHVDHPTPSEPSEPSNPVTGYVSAHTHYDKKQDDLLDVHVGNPLEKITRLLEDIKRQKAFSFTLKGSLGVAGVVLALGVLGVFGSNQMLCAHGTQSFVGIVKTLQYQDEEKSSIPYFSRVRSYFFPSVTHRRVVIITNEGKIISIPYKRSFNLAGYEGKNVIVTGNYNSCSQTVEVMDGIAIELLE